MVILRSLLLEDAGFRHGFAERSATVDAMAEALGVSRVIQVKQVHGCRALETSEIIEGTEADAIVSRAATHPIAVGVRVADCVPILVADPMSGDVAAIHAGWRGIVAGVLREAIARLREPRMVLAAIGPCIGECCFEVSVDVAEKIAHASAGRDVVVHRQDDKAWVDLRAAVRAQLFSVGPSDIRVEDVVGCTKHEPDRFHSFRRDGDQSGRMLAAIRPRPIE
jgi:purine-nucleoside/S-methyl-5'-thioadenosine phosphorylase / adenosine deaminase